MLSEPPSGTKRARAVDHNSSQDPHGGRRKRYELFLKWLVRGDGAADGEAVGPCVGVSRQSRNELSGCSLPASSARASAKIVVRLGK